MSMLGESEQLMGNYGSIADQTVSQTSSFTHKSTSTESSQSGVNDFEEIQVSESGGRFGIENSSTKTSICSCMWLMSPIVVGVCI